MSPLRDTTRALILARRAKERLCPHADPLETDAARRDADELIQILQDQDARTGRRDPSVRDDGK